MSAFYNSVDTVLIGRKTFEMGMTLGQSDFPDKENFVFSQSQTRSPVRDVGYICESITEFARHLRSREGKDIWLVGGAGLIGSLRTPN